jgi:hypothetical protein
MPDVTRRVNVTQREVGVTPSDVGGNVMDVLFFTPSLSPPSNSVSVISLSVSVSVSVSLL